MTKGYDPLIKEIANKQKVNPYLIKAVIKIETNGTFNPNIIHYNRKNQPIAYGLMGIKEKTWDWIVRDILKKRWRFKTWRFRPKQNINVGVAFLIWLENYYKRAYQKPFKGNRLVRYQLVGYVWGIGMFKSIFFQYKNVPKSVKSYVNAVLKTKREYEMEHVNGRK